VLAFLMLVCTALPAAGQEASTKKSPTPIGIPAEPLGLKAGAPLSPRTLVARPPALRGAVSWTLETRRHRGPLYTLAVSPDDRLIATGGMDGIVRIWERETGNFVRALVGHASYIYGLAFSPDGNTLASAGSHDATARLWDLRSGHPLRVLTGHPGYTQHVAWAPDGKTLIVAGGPSGFAWQWDVVKGRALHKVELGHPIPSMAWVPDGQSAVFAVSTAQAQLWDLNSGKVTLTFGQASDGILCVAVAPDGKTLAAGCNRVTNFYELESAKQVRTLPIGFGYAAWSPDGKSLALCNVNGLHLCDTKTFVPQKTPQARANIVAWTQDSRGVTLVNPDQVVVTEVPAVKVLRTLDIAGKAPVIWTPRRPLVSGLGGATVTLWDATTGKSLFALEGHQGAVNAVAWMPDGDLLAGGGGDKVIRLWKSGTGKLLHTLEGHTGAIAALAFASDGKTLASGGADKIVRLWDPAAGKITRLLEGHEEGVTVLAWSPGGKLLASGSADRSVRIWNPKTGQLQISFRTHPGPVLSLAWAPDGKSLASGSTDALVNLHNASTGKSLQTFDQAGSPPAVTALAFAANGAVLLAGRANYTCQLWNVHTGKVEHNLQALAPVERVGWSPGGSTAASGNQDRTVRFWDAATGQPRGTLIAEPNQVTAVSSEGHYRHAPGVEPDLVYVVQLERGQETLTLAEFAMKYHWKNLPPQVKLTGN